MNLNELLERCQVEHAGDWAEVPGERPATAMIGGVHGTHLAVYVPNPALSLLWLVPDDLEDGHDNRLPEWAEEDTNDWRASSGYVAVLLNGAPVWQVYASYMTWGAGVGGFVPQIDRALHDGVERGYPASEVWTTTKWEIGLASLLNSIVFVPRDWHSFDPVSRLVSRPVSGNPVDSARYQP